MGSEKELRNLVLKAAGLSISKKFKSPKELWQTNPDYSKNLRTSTGCAKSIAYLNENHGLVLWLSTDYKTKTKKIFHKYGLKTKYHLIKGKTRKELEEMIVEHFSQFLKTEEFIYEDFSGQVVRVIEALKKKFDQTSRSCKFWKIMVCSTPIQGKLGWRR